MYNKERSYGFNSKTLSLNIKAVEILPAMLE